MIIIQFFPLEISLIGHFVTLYILVFFKWIVSVFLVAINEIISFVDYKNISYKPPSMCSHIILKEK